MLKTKRYEISLVCAINKWFKSLAIHYGTVGLIGGKGCCLVYLNRSMYLKRMYLKRILLFFLTSWVTNYVALRHTISFSELHGKIVCNELSYQLQYTEQLSIWLAHKIAHKYFRAIVVLEMVDKISDAIGHITNTTHSAFLFIVPRHFIHLITTCY